MRLHQRKIQKVICVSPKCLQSFLENNNAGFVCQGGDACLFGMPSEWAIFWRQGSWRRAPPKRGLKVRSRISRAMLLDQITDSELPLGA